jgi:two-component system cell cycle response regulator CpdR
MNILIAEDNAFTSKQYKMALEKNGHTVSLTTDGVECIDEYVNEAQYSELFRKDKSPPFDVVLLDHDMPRKNGAEVAKEILERRPNQRIIFLSAYGQGILNNIGELRDDTVQIIQKPFSLSFLLRKIQGHLISNRIISAEQVGKPLSITQDTAALR